MGKLTLNKNKQKKKEIYLIYKIIRIIYKFIKNNNMIKWIKQNKLIF